MIYRIFNLRYFLTVFVILTVNLQIRSQVTVERSKDKVVISGITYYVHEVKKGETVYSISRAYGISVEQLAKENPYSLSGLKEGQNLKIPSTLVDSVPGTQVTQQQTTSRDENKYIYHKLQPGETIYYLSRTYSVSENDIVQSNPGIDINKLPLGYEIVIPRKELMNQKQNFSQRDTQAFYHKVVKGETMASIAQHYGLSVRELRRVNRETRFPQVGDYLRIPGMKVPETGPIEEAARDTTPIAREEPVVYLERPSDFTPVRNLQGSFKVAVLLPFYLDENMSRSEIDSSKSAKGKKIYKVINRSDDWIYPRSLGFVEMYEGILLAADTLRSLGLDVDINAFDIKNDTDEVIRLINSGRLASMNLIIGPVFSNDLALVASYAGSLGIPVVSPVQLSNNSALVNNPTLFMASSSLEVAQNAIARKIADFYNSNLILIHSDSEVENQDYNRFKGMVLNELSTKMPFEEIKLKDFVFYSRSLFGNDSINRLAHALSDHSPNVIIIASEDGPVMSESLTNVHALSRKYNLNVFGYPNMRYLDNFDHKICFDLGLMIYSPYWIDNSRKNVKQFNSDFREKFFTEPSEISYAWTGYDISYYFLSGLAIYGREFIAHPEIHNPELLHTNYDFRRKSVSDGFENERLFLVRYSNNYDLELVKDDNISLLK